MKQKLPKGWIKTKLKDIAILIMGQSPPGSSYNTEKMGIPLLNGAADFQEKTISPNQFTISPTKLSKKNDILFCIRATIGKVTLSDKEYCLGRGVAALRVKENIMDKKLLMKILDSELKQLVLQGSTIKGVRKEDLEKIEILVPPITTQKNIVNILENVEKAKEFRYESDELTKNFLKSVFYDMFGDPLKNNKGWVLKKLGKLSSIGSSRRVFVDEFVEEGIPFYRGTEIGALSESGNISPKFFITEEHYLKLKESTGVPAIGDLLLPSICFDGRIWQVDTRKPFYFKDGRVLWIHLEKPGIDSTYLQYLLHENFLRNYNQIASGTTFSELKIFALKNLDVMMPPASLQNKFASIVKEVKDMKEQQKQSRMQIHNLFNHMMQKIFKGELAC